MGGGTGAGGRTGSGTADDFGLFARATPGAVAALFTFVLVLLAAMAAFGTCFVQFRSQTGVDEHTFFLSDNPFVNVAAAVALVAAAYALSRSKPLGAFRARLADDRFFRRCKISVLAVLCILSLAWVACTLAVPASDQLLVQKAVLEGRAGDWTLFSEDEYMSRYPSQHGLFLVSWLLALVFGKYTSAAFQLVNVAGVLVVCSSLAAIAGRSGASRLQQLATMCSCIAFYPLVQYCSFVYGTMWGLALSLLAVRLEMDFLEGLRLRRAIGAAACITLAVMLKGNYAVFMIGMVLYALVELVDARALKAGAVIVLVLAGFAFASVAPTAAVGAISGQRVGSGASSWSWVAMGLQDGDLAPGWYNGYNWESHVEAGYDTQVQAEAAKEDALASLSQFASGERDPVAFFSKKVASQWNNPTFQGYWNMQRSRAALPVLPLTAAVLSADGVDAAVRCYLDPLQFAVLAGALAWAVLARRDGRRFRRALVLPLVFLGGFACHLLWEAKCQYALPYFTLLLPYAVMGYSLTAAGVGRIVRGVGPGLGGRFPQLAVLAASCLLTCAIFAGGGLASITGEGDAYAQWLASGPVPPYLSGSVLDQALDYAGS